MFCMYKIVHQREVFLQNRSPVVRAHVAVKYLYSREKLTKEREVIKQNMPSKSLVYKLGHEELVLRSTWGG